MILYFVTKYIYKLSLTKKPPAVTMPRGLIKADGIGVRLKNILSLLYIQRENCYFFMTFIF